MSGAARLYVTPCALTVASEAVPGSETAPVLGLPARTVQQMALRAVRFAALPMLTVAHRVIAIGALGIPTQIREMIIRRIVVIVASLHAIRARADERLKHKPMNQGQAAAVVSPEVRLKATVCSPVQAQQLAPITTLASAAPAREADERAINRSHAASITHLVKAFITDNRQPAFHSPYLTWVDAEARA